MPTWNLDDWQKVWPLKASHLQQAVDVIRPLMTMIGDGGITASQTQHGTVFSALSELYRVGYYPIINNSGADRNRFDVLHMDGPMFDAATHLDLFLSFIGFKGIIPPNTAHIGRWGVLPLPIKKGEIGVVHLGLVEIARIQLSSPDDRCVGAIGNDPTKLTSGPTGVGQLLASSANGGTTYAYIRMGTNPNWKNCST